MAIALSLLQAKTDKVVQCLLKVTIPTNLKSTWFKQTLNNFVSFVLFLQNFQELIFVKNTIIYCGHA